MVDRYTHAIPRPVGDDSDYEEAMKSKRMADRESKKIFVQMLVNDYICKDKTWEDLKREQRPSGSMSEWTRDLAIMLGMKSDTNYSLMSPPVSPSVSPIGKLKKKRSKTRKKVVSKRSKRKGTKSKTRRKSKVRKTKGRKTKARKTKRRKN